MIPDRATRQKLVLENRLKSICLVAESTYMRHNLSAMLRSAEAFGVQDVHFVSDSHPTEPLRSAVDGFQ